MKTWRGFLDAPRVYFIRCRIAPRKRAGCVAASDEYDRLVTILIDEPRWPAHGRLWAHLVSDSDLAELHAFAAANGIPRRGFDRDHYDVPSEYYDAAVAAGAVPVSSRDLVVMLVRAGLRRRKNAPVPDATEED